MAKRTTYSEKRKNQIVEELKGDYRACNLEHIAAENLTSAQNLRNWCITAGKITPKKRDSQKSSAPVKPIRITSKMRAHFAEEMEAHSDKEDAIDEIEEAIIEKQEEIDTLQAEYDLKDAELIKIQTGIEKSLGMI